MRTDLPWVALAGCPNTGKTTLFNALTGRRARVGNYPGITVERVSAQAATPGGPVVVVDVPGAYSLAARSPDEQVAVAALLGLGANPRPALTIVALDATRLERNLYFALQIIELGAPVVLAVNMMDAAKKEGITLDLPAMADALGVPVVGVSAARGEGIDALRAAIAEALARPPAPPAWTWTPGPELEADLAALAPAAAQMGTDLSPAATRALALWALLSVDSSDELADVPATLRLQVLARLKAARAAGRDVDGEGVTARYQWIDQHLGAWITRGPVPRSWTDRLDAVLLHPVAGFALFLGIMVVVFQALFAWSEPLIGLVEGGIGWVGTAVRSLVPAGILADFLAEAVVGGVGNVLVFVPQIALLFIFISLMEDTGYMSRIAFLMDRIMNRVGLHGRAFVPMLSAYACAVPAVMATRTMERRRDRYLTMMVLPLTTCSARLPVYTLLIAALVPATIAEASSAPGSPAMVGLYLFGTVTALVAAAVIGRTVLKGSASRC
ncbi:MAG: ferrous iron transport protein B [bacterium]